MIPARVLYFLLILLLVILVGIYHAWAQCAPDDLICMNIGD